MDRAEKAALCEIHALSGVGTGTLWKGFNEWGSFAEMYKANEAALYKILPTEAVTDLIQRRRSRTSWDCLEKIEAHGFQVVSILDDNYPVLLKTIHNPPFVIYCAGNLELWTGFCLAIVGSRNATHYGRNTSRKLSEELAAYGVIVVSGMARGIDAEAHTGALNTGTTIAVLGSGLNVVYPRENQSLYERIRMQGLVISEFPMDTPPDSKHFPMRNRIISGLSRGVIVVEARERSGALITADMALEQGRDVMAVPGPITSKNSVGTNRLIQQGAKLVMDIQDIIDEYPDFDWQSASPPVIVEGVLFAEEDSEEAEILQLIEVDGIHFDELLQRTSLDHGTLSSLLLKLELKGIVTSTPGNYYVKIR
ncbi:MAG TPA: DNA-processing protein DprA [Syntrophomonadaceae bacterium]|mgnify:CR=1 FL=1|nr:DNA-processing protein DprA [Syntrophomonadaceae bacterium]HQE23491.1 DNA-processing protein DprA [Syntrophomonadaceae bacterium]